MPSFGKSRGKYARHEAPCPVHFAASQLGALRIVSLLALTRLSTNVAIHAEALEGGIRMRRTAKIFTAVAAAAGSLLASTAMHAQETRKPNILFIMGDDSMSQGPQTAQR